MISHKYEDYASRLGIHALDALIAVLLWPTLAVIALWWWRGMPTIFSHDAPALGGEGRTGIAFLAIAMGALKWFSHNLQYLNIPFELDDPRRAVVYPVALYNLRLMRLCLALGILLIAALFYAPQLEAHKVPAILIATSPLAIGLPLYIHRIAKLRKRKDLRRDGDEGLKNH